MKRAFLRLGLAALTVATTSLPATAAKPTYVDPPASQPTGRAPQMQARTLSTAADGTRDFVLVFGKGDSLVAGLTEWAAKENIGAARLTAIGAFSKAQFGWFDRGRKSYREIPVDMQVECLGLTGDIGQVDGKPALHIHGTVGLPDGSTRGGHLLEATVWPTLEVFVTAYPQPLPKRQDAETGLDLYSLGD